MIMNTSFFLICVCALLLMAVGMIFAKPILLLFGSSENGLIYAYPYLMIYLLGTFPSMVSTGMNPFINAQGYATTGMFSVAIGAIANLILDPVFIFVFGLGIRGAAIATVLSQILSAAFVLYFLRKKTELKVRLLSGEEIRDCGRRAKNIISLGTAGFIMQLTNSLVTICCNNVLSVTGGDLYISVMTIVSSIRQIIDTPIHAITEGSSPVISYNYGARRPKRVFQSWLTMSVMAILYTLLAWGVILFAPRFLIGIFSSDQALITDAIPALKLYFGAFVFQALQYVGQTMFKSLGKKKFAIFFSLLRKVIIVVPLTYILPYLFHMGSDGVFLAEPVSNVLGGSACFIVMLCTVMPELKRMAKENSDC
jgi:putative MATE family efflux protein